jgi:hypothetical protein
MTKSSALTSTSGLFRGSVTAASAMRLAPVCESGDWAALVAPVSAARQVRTRANTSGAL